MARQDELREEAKSKRHLAGLARRAAPGMSMARDRASLLDAALKYEREASALEAQADAIDTRRRQDDRRGSVPDGEIRPRKD